MKSGNWLLFGLSVYELLSYFGLLSLDLLNGSQIEIYKANEYAAGHPDEKQSYGIEAIFMAENGLFVYAEGETGAHDFYQVGGGKYMNINDDLGVFVYGAYASADDIHSSERSHILRADLGFSKDIGSVAEFSFNYVI